MKKINFLIMIAAFASLISLVPVSALSVVVHVPEKYTEVTTGERFYFEIEVKYPENPSRKDLRLNYEILRDGEVIAQSKVLKAVETQASFIDFIVIPESADSGFHIIKVRISDYENLSEEVSASFHVIGKKGDQLMMYFFILLGAIAFVSLLVMIQIHHLKQMRQ